MQLVVSAIILNLKNQVLLLKKSSRSKYFPNKWTCPGGHINQDEDIKEALIREINEELGIKVKIIKQGKSIFFENNKIIPFLVRAKNNRLVLSKEHQEYKWVDINKVKNFDIIPSITDNLKVLGLL